HKRGLEPGRALANARGTALARALVAARANAGPGSEMGVAGKAAHISTDLREDLHCGKGLDARHGPHLLDGGTKGRKPGLHLLVDFVDGSIEGVDLIEVKTQNEAVLAGHTATQGLAQRRL